jgi:hypothetical protein
MAISLCEYVLNAGEAGLDGRALMKLSHIILSHHGKLENWAPEPPMLVETILVHYADERVHRWILPDALPESTGCRRGYGMPERLLDNSDYLDDSITTNL